MVFIFNIKLWTLLGNSFWMNKWLNEDEWWRLISVNVKVNVKISWTWAFPVNVNVHFNSSLI